MASSIQNRLGRVENAGMKAPASAYASTNITLSGLQTIDGHVGSSGDRIVVGGQTDAFDNGIYIMSASGWERAPDFNDNGEVQNGAMIPVYNPNGFSSILQFRFSGSLTIGTTPITVYAFAFVYSTAVDSNLISDADSTYTIGNAANNFLTIFLDPTALGTAASDDKYLVLDTSADNQAKFVPASEVQTNLNGASLTDIGTPASNDRIIIQDANDDGNLKTFDVDELSGNADVTHTTGAELDINTVNVYALDNGAASFQLPDLAGVSADDKITLKLRGKVSTSSAKVQLSENAADGGGLFWLGTAGGDCIYLVSDGTDWFVTEHYETIYADLSLKADESIAAETSEQVVGLTADLDTASLYDGVTNFEIVAPLDAYVDFSWNPDTYTSVSSNDLIQPEAKMQNNYIRQVTTGSGSWSITRFNLLMLSGNHLQFWAFNDDDSAQSLGGNASGTESQAFVTMRWRY